jgi:predicted ATPase/class 3 adenylate cyclase
MSEHLAVLLTDIVDSTRLAVELGDAAIGAHWAAHTRISRDLLRAWGGREIERTDGFHACFDTAAAAAGCALAYHRALDAAGLPFKARAGVHVGPVTLTENSQADVALGGPKFEVDGLAVSVAARLMATALGGQTLLSADARAALGATALRLQAHGHWRFKGLADPIEIFEIGDAHAPFVPPSDHDKAYRVALLDDLWQPVRAIRNSLPVERSTFVGRRQALQELAASVEDARLVSVLGFGGMGKTRLALRYGRAWLGDFPGGVWFCDLSQARSLDGLVQAVAQGLDVPLGQTDPVTQIGNSLAGRGACLVILDNFEQVTQLAEPTVGGWLDRAPLARFIVTSREVLGIQGEKALTLAPLDPDDAVALFMARAAAIHPAFDPRGEERIAIASLVELLDRLPLAIELAAARVSVMPPRELLKRMNERFAVLISRHGRQSRQATLRATFDWSWELLSPAERSALAQASVFEGSFALDAFESVVSLHDIAAAPPAIDVLQSLVEKSLVRQRSELRFDLMVSVREYAAEQLGTALAFPNSGPDAVAATRRRHCAFFAAFAEADADAAMLAAAWADLDNLVVACRRAVAFDDAHSAVGALQGAWAGLRMRGPFQVGVELAALVRGLAGLSPREAARVARLHGWTLQQSGRSAEAGACFEAALGLARAAGDAVTERRVLSHLGNWHIEGGRMEQARAELDAALALARGAHDAALECEVLCELGNLAEHLGNLDAASDCYDRCLAVARAAGNRNWEGGSRGNLGLLCTTLGRLDEARGHYEAGLAVARELGTRRWEATTLCNLGLLHHAQGRPAEARATLDAALTVAREMGYVRLGAIVMCNLGIVCEALGAPDEAKAHHENALAVARELNDRRSAGQFLNYLGLLHARQGRIAEGMACLDEGEMLLTEVADKLNLGVLLCSKAEAHLRAGSPQSADAALERARALQQEVGAGQDSELGQSLERLRQLKASSASAST